MFFKDSCIPFKCKTQDDKSDDEIYKKLIKIENNIKQFVDEGGNIFLYSSICGNGKTSWAIRLLCSYFNVAWVKSNPLVCEGLFINVPRFLIALKDNISNYNEYADYIIHNVMDASLVVWDEVATKSLTPYEHEQLLTLINARLDAKKSNIYTSNLTPQELGIALGDRLYSRIVNASQNFEFKTQDKRPYTILKSNENNTIKKADEVGDTNAE